jgi:hypothetical protein
MKAMRLPLCIGLVFINYGIANAMTSKGYDLTQESFSLAISIISLILAIIIFKELSGGALAQPWILIAVGFALAGAASLISLLNLNAVFFTQYDLRPILFFTRTGGMLLTLVGLIFYKKRLQ